MYGNGTDDEVAEGTAQKLDKTLENRWRRLLWILYQDAREYNGPKNGPILSEQVVAQVIAALRCRGTASPHSEVELRIRVEDSPGSADSKISMLQEKLDKDTYSITQQLPGLFDFDGVPFQLECRINPLNFQFIFPQRVLNFCKYDGDNYYSDRKDEEYSFPGCVYPPKSLLQRQLWRLQDLRDADGFGFTVELFLLALQQLLSTSSSRESSSVLFIGTLRVITCDWSKHKHCLATQKILLDVVASAEGILHLYDYPTYITDQLWKLLGDMLERQSGLHMENVVQQLTDCQHLDGHKYGAKALEVISRIQSPSSNRYGIL
jgi:hypothetical protein